MLKFVIVIRTNMYRFLLTILLTLTVLTSKAQKNTFKAFGSEWRVFGVTGVIGGSTNREGYKVNYSELKNVVTSEDYQLQNMQRAIDSGYSFIGSRLTGNNWRVQFVIKPITMSNRKFFSLQEFHIGISQVWEYTHKQYQWLTELSPNSFRLNYSNIYQDYKTTFIEPKWIVRTQDLGSSLVLYTGLGARIGIGGYSDIEDNYRYDEYFFDEQVFDSEREENYHNLAPNNTYMVYMPFGLKKYISCRLNFVAEFFYGRGVTKIQDKGDWNYESSGFSIGLQYKFQKPVKLDGGDGKGDTSPDKGGVFW